MERQTLKHFKVINLCNSIHFCCNQCKMFATSARDRSVVITCRLPYCFESGVATLSNNAVPTHKVQADMKKEVFEVCNTATSHREKDTFRYNLTVLYQLIDCLQKLHPVLPSRTPR